VTAATCNQCHPSTVNVNGTINVATGAHVNGLPNVAAGCTACHGTAGRVVPVGNPNALLPSAPPVAPPGSPASVVGTHLLHLTDSTIRAAVNCNECHVVPGNADHSVQFPTVIVFSPGTLATTQGAAPSYNGTTLSCSATYCHGNFTFGGVSGNSAATPAWNATPTLSCTGCHGMPPVGHPTLTGTVTAATCNQCHPATVLSSGAIDVAGGKHMNGASDVTGNPHTGDPLWVDRTHHGFSASSQGLQNCTNCHTNFGGPSGGSAGSCNACHTALGFATWQTNCTFCHGTTGRAGNVTGTDASLAASPPVGPQGQTLTTDPMVGAHQRHVNPPSTGRVAQPFACVVCHASPLPANVDHVNGQAVPIPFGGVALTGNVRPTFNPVTLSCSATYCHGNFTGGATTAAPLWTGGAMTCSSCHGLPPGTGQHGRSEHRAAGCGACHSGYSSSAANVLLHLNGVKNVGGAGTSINSWNASTRQCAPACHGGQTW
jgi:predicted CxxxxCH...CXXCH cytochrome family protein